MSLDHAVSSFSGVMISPQGFVKLGALFPSVGNHMQVWKRLHREEKREKGGKRKKKRKK